MWWKGLDGLQGPILSGIDFYLRRDAIYGPLSSSLQYMFSCMEVDELKAIFRHSKGPMLRLPRGTIARNVLPHDVTCVVSCAYETGTKWGEEVGLLY